MDTLSISPNLLNQLSFSLDELATIRAIGEYRGKQDLYSKQSPEILENLRTVAKIESSESSNRIEGIVISRQRVEDIINHPTELLKNRPEQEVAGYRDALQLIHESAEYMPISSNVVLQLHSLICKYAPNPGGRWKSRNNEIIETTSTGEKKIRFKAVSAVQTPHAMNEWDLYYRDAIQTIDPLIVVPLSILDFLCIHPFLDGNGRVSRLLTLLLLYKADYQIGRYVSLERIIEQSKESYYETLQKSSQGWHEGKQDVKPWLHYFWGVLIRAYRELDEKVSDIKGGKGSKTEMIRQAVKSMIGPFSISDIQGQLPTIGRDMIKLVLANLKNEKLIALQGKGRGTKWLAIPGRFRALLECLRKQYPSDNWGFTTATVFNPLNGREKAFDIYDELLGTLDSDSFEFLKKKASKAFPETREASSRGKEAFFDSLNEAFGYKYLQKKGFENIQFLENDNTKSRTPDLCFEANGICGYCEVKTINGSETYHDDLQKNAVRHFGPEDLKKMYKKVSKTVDGAINQIQCMKPANISQCIVYLIFSRNSDIGFDLSNYKEEFKKNLKAKCILVLQFDDIFGFENSLIIKPSSTHNTN